MRTHCFALWLLACGLAHASVASAAAATYWPTPALSGSWYDASRNGEGFIFEYLPNGQVVAAWFTYPALGEAGEQLWLLGVGDISGNRIHFGQIYRTDGGVWGEAFDAARIVRSDWGTLDVDFSDCNTATAHYVGPPAYGSGELQLTRLTSVDQLDCSGNARALTAHGGRAPDGLRSRSGPWWVPTRSGEGWFFEELPGGALLVYWFTFDPQGRPAYLIGVGVRDGTHVRIDSTHVTRGTHFGAAFDANAVQRVHWGTFDIDLSSCQASELRYDSVLAGYGNGARSAVRLSELAGAPCLDATPSGLTQGTWSEAAPLPAPAQSELAAVTLDGKLYALGGFGDPRGFKRYDPTLDTWTRLASLPAGRDHLAAFALGGAVYFTGGASNGDGDQTTPGFRYDVAVDRWDPVPELPFTYGTHAATLNGRAYIGDSDGGLIEYDPRQHRVRFIDRPNNTERDHSQTVAFQGEIWVLGGRLPENGTVAIYDLAADRWRVGPPLRAARGGFAATVVAQQIVIGGGEIISGTPHVLGSTEVYAAGGDRWEAGPALPVPVHGVVAATFGNQAYFVSGGTVATSRCCATGRVFALRFAPQ